MSDNPNVKGRFPHPNKQKVDIDLNAYSGQPKVPLNPVINEKEFAKEVIKEGCAIELFKQKHPNIKLPILKTHTTREKLTLGELFKSDLISGETFKEKLTEIDERVMEKEEIETLIRYLQREIAITKKQQ